MSKQKRKLRCFVALALEQLHQIGTAANHQKINRYHLTVGNFFRTSTDTRSH